MVRRSGRSRSRGRPDRFESENYVEKPAPAPKTPKAKKAKAEEEAKKLEFSLGDTVMARWPGSSLFFKAKVTLVREEDDEYDVEYENGTVYTLRSKDVYKADSKVLKKAAGSRRSKSRGRGRSAGRQKKAKEAPAPAPAPAASEESADEAAADKTDSKPAEKVVKTPKPKPAVVAPTPTRQSARIAAKAVTDAFSDDETEKVKLAPNPELPDARGKKKGWSFQWVMALVFMVLGPVILISLHTLCTKTSCKPQVPKLSTDIKDYFSWNAFYIVMAVGFVVPTFGLLPVGKVVNGERMSGFTVLLMTLFTIPALVYYKVPLNIVGDNYFQIMVTCIAFSFVDSLGYYAMSFLAPKNQLNSKGNTGNPIVDIYNGRSLNPKVLGQDVKLMSFRFAMLSLALLNVVMVADSIVSAGGKANPAVILAAAFQVFYAMDAMFFEEYYFYSYDVLNSGCGWSLASTYLTFPFLPTLITRYLLDRNPVVAWYYLLLIGVMNAIGYIIFRSSETTKCEFAKDPANPSLAHLDTITAGNKKLIVSGWWNTVRHPNYLGEVLIQWSWVLPAGFTDLIPYYLPVVSTVMLISRCQQINQRNKRKYGTAWSTYCERVRSNILPKVY